MWVQRGAIQMKTWMIIPVLLYVSQSKIKKPNKKSGGTVWSLHITPWFAVGIDWRSKSVEFDE